MKGVGPSNPPGAVRPMKPWMCGARRRNGLPCRKAGIAPSGRCRLHGGKTPGGIASPHFKTGRYSGYMPRGLRGTLASLEKDPELLSLHHMIALVDVRVVGLIRQLKNGPGQSAIWRQISAAVRIQARLVSQETRRLRDLGMFISADRALALVRGIMAIVLRHVPETERRSKIAREIETLLGSVNASGCANKP